MSSEEPVPEFDTIFFENGDYYEGDVVNNVPHGFGRMYYSDGYVDSNWRYGVRVLIANPDRNIPGYDEDKYQKLAVINRHTFCVGYTYHKDTIAEAFEISGFVRGIRIHRDKAVLFSLSGSIYKDGIGWEKDKDGEDVFVYTGEGLSGNQKMNRNNSFLCNSRGKGIYLFVKRRPSQYVFYGAVDVKRFYEAIEPDKNGDARSVYKFVLRRHLVE